MRKNFLRVINFWKNKNVLITGDSGFKGSWLLCLLLKLGSKVNGISLKTDASNILFNCLNNDEDFINFQKKGLYIHNELDIRDKEKLKILIKNLKPDVIFHLAAQPLVRESYTNPHLTWDTNVMGTINLLEGIRNLDDCSVVIVTTDKVYENFSWSYSYREDDRLGGKDPYSSSKAAVELAVKSWRQSFYENNNNIKISSARAGNVIGGGDWAKDRIVPDAINSLIKGSNLFLRYPNATRPWQHVLDPLFGYLILAENQFKAQKSFAYNFGPYDLDIVTVKDLVLKIAQEWGGEIKIEYQENQLPESDLLTLSINKSIKELKWAPKWGINKTIKETVNWYKKVNEGKSAYRCISENIDCFLNIQN